MTLALNCWFESSDGSLDARGLQLSETSDSQGFHHRVGSQVATHPKMEVVKQGYEAQCNPLQLQLPSAGMAPLKRRARSYWGWPVLSFHPLRLKPSQLRCVC